LAEDVMKLEAMSADERRALGVAGRKWLLENTGVRQWQDAFDAVLRKVMERAT
jgi:hypothetical protein